MGATSGAGGEIACACRSLRMKTSTVSFFGELVFRQRKLSPGVMLVRLHALSPEKRAARIAEIAGQHGADLRGAFTVVTTRAVRIRTMH